MVSQTLRSGWLVAALAYFFALTVFSQTAPRIVVTFDPVIGAANYRVQTAVGSLPFSTAAECAAPPCIVNGVEGTTTYKVRVAGVESNSKEGFYSAPVEFMFASIQPLSPASITANAETSTQPGKVAKKLSWPAVTKFRTGTAFPAGAVVKYSLSQAEGTLIIFDSLTNSMTVQGLSKHKSYQFWVTCVVDGIESFKSPALRVNT